MARAPCNSFHSMIGSMVVAAAAAAGDDDDNVAAAVAGAASASIASGESAHFCDFYAVDNSRSS